MKRKTEKEMIRGSDLERAIMRRRVPKLRNQLVVREKEEKRTFF